MDVSLSVSPIRTARPVSWRAPATFPGACSTSSARKGGTLWLVVDNVNQDATDLDFTLSVDVQPAEEQPAVERRRDGAAELLQLCRHVGCVAIDVVVCAEVLRVLRLALAAHDGADAHARRQRDLVDLPAHQPGCLGVAAGHACYRDGAVPMVALAMFGMTGVGAGEITAYTYWVVEKGYAAWAGPNDGSPEWVRRARGWIRVMKVDAWVAWVIYTISTAAFYMLGAAVLNPQGLVPVLQQAGMTAAVCALVAADTPSVARDAAVDPREGDFLAPRCT